MASIITVEERLKIVKMIHWAKNGIKPEKVDKFLESNIKRLKDLGQEDKVKKILKE